MKGSPRGKNASKILVAHCVNDMRANKDGPSSKLGPSPTASINLVLCTLNDKNKSHRQEGSRNPREINGNPTTKPFATAWSLNAEESDTQVEERVPESPTDWEPSK
ncbi:hypothetical protein QL285_094380 [Trifolium repens]|jgi:hypothetical protein|nr:hypothetical protein QL285_094380 [Trifolium repens]